ncbi:MAG: S8 family serine peptidase [Lachnospiraceae bacterium]|nr:S8 family serine peptidase [Lachnospiraceae bacterium]
MKGKIKIAVIDNGINRDLVKEEKLRDEFVVDANNECKEEHSEIQITDFMHGTICALIIEKYCPDCVFSSIRILDQSGKGGIEKIEPALEWCCQNNVNVVNLSLGTTHFKENEKLSKLINKYTHMGLIIIAAISNIGLFTYPASFSNVIGVATMNSPLLYNNDYIHLGIDTVVPSEHIIKLNDQEHKSSLSNSYATPYVSSMVLKKIMEDETCDIHTLKEYVRKKSHVAMKEGLYNPDWVYKAYIKNKKSESKADYYFETVIGNYEEVKHDCDTIIAYSKIELEQINIENKNLIYLGNDDIENINISGFKWSWNTKVQQIVKNQFKGNGLDIPLIIFDIADSLDKYFILSKLRQQFEKDGYNAYAVDMEPESVLYKLEYIPAIQFPLTDQLVRDYVEGQVFYKQSDLVLWNASREQKKHVYTIYPAYDIEIIFRELEVLVYIEKELSYRQIYNTLPEEHISVIYDLIVGCLAEEQHE